MMATVKDFVSSIDLAKRLDVAADIARSVGNSAAQLAKRSRRSASDLAKTAGGSAVVMAKKVGPRRALIGLAVVGAAIGGIYLVRYLRANRDEDLEFEADEEPQTAAGRRQRKETRAKRKANAAAITH